MGQLNAIVTYNEKLNDEYHVMRVRPIEGEINDFIPGQYAELGVPDPRAESADSNQKMVRRLYSIASPNTIKDYLEFYIINVKDGLVSPHIISKKEGERIYLNPKINGKFGGNFEQDATGKDVICIATGTGLAPFLSMFKSFKNHLPWKSFTIIHCARFIRDLGYKEELEAYDKKYSNFFYIPTVTRETKESGWNGLTGRVGELLKRGDYENTTGIQISPDTTNILICGGKDMVQDLVTQLTEQGFTKGYNLFFERYW